MISAVSASSSIIYVNGSHGSDENDGLSWTNAKLTIANAVGTVSNGGTVNIANGVYTGTKNTGIIVNKNITIKGQSKDGTIINGSNRASMFRILAGNNVIIHNLTLTNGNTNYGGAIFNMGNLVVNNCIFINNHAISGGAIYSTGNLDISASTFTSNTATVDDGGAIVNKGGHLTVTDSILTSNVAHDGGGAIHNYGPLTVTNCTFTRNKADHAGGVEDNNECAKIYTSFLINNRFYNNSATVWGGAIIINNNAIFTISGSTFINNIAKYGGNIYNKGNLNVKGSIFTSNTATGSGGAIYNGKSLTVSNSTFTSNHATTGGAVCSIGKLTVSNSAFTSNHATYGGSIYSNGKSLTVSSSTFSSNIAKTNGGAIYNNEGAATVTSSSFVHNSAPYGGAIINNGNALTVRGSTLKSNHATRNGGAIYNSAKGPLTVTCSTLNSNSASYGGAILNKNTKSQIHYCRIVGNTATKNGKAIYNYGKISASLNWWGSNANPSAKVRGLKVTQWLILTIKASPKTISNNGYSSINVDLLHDNHRHLVKGYVPNKIAVTFNTTLGHISQSSTVNGVAKSILNSDSIGGTATISARLDNQIVKTAVKIS